jgi:hypothetical protein
MKIKGFQDLAQKWPSTYVARCQIESFTGDMVSRGTLANADSEWKGPASRIRMGRKIGYPVDALIEWLEERTVEL